MMNYKIFIKYFGHFFSIISIVIIAKILIENTDKLKHIEFSKYHLLIIILLIAWGLVGYILIAYTWVMQLKNKYPKFRYLMSLKIIASTQISKYLPGNVGHYIGRFYLSKNHLSNADITYTILIENIIFLLSYCLIGSFYLFHIDVEKLIITSNLTYITMGVMIALGLIISFVYYLKTNLDLITINLQVILKLLLIFSIIALLGGLTIYLIFYVLLSNTVVNIFLCISAFSLSFLLGFIVPGAPGGIGVREYTFTVLMSPFIEEFYAVEAIVLFRIITICTDVLLYFIGKRIQVKI